MGSLVILASQVSRVYSFKNSVAAAAFLMIFFNPKIAVFDMGFLLSFFSLLGISYLFPILDKSVKFKSGFLEGPKGVIFETISAQAAVLPLLAASFGGVSLTALVSNAILLPLMPFSMLLVFLTGLAGLVFPLGAQVLSFLVHPLLSFEVWVIRFFGGVSVLPMNFGWAFFVVYSAALIAFAVKYYPKTDETNPF